MQQNHSKSLKKKYLRHKEKSNEAINFEYMRKGKTMLVQCLQKAIWQRPRIWYISKLDCLSRERGKVKKKKKIWLLLEKSVHQKYITLTKYTNELLEYFKDN